MARTGESSYQRFSGQDPREISRLYPVEFWSWELAPAISVPATVNHRPLIAEPVWVTLKRWPIPGDDSAAIAVQSAFGAEGNPSPEVNRVSDRA